MWMLICHPVPHSNYGQGIGLILWNVKSTIRLGPCPEGVYDQLGKGKYKDVNTYRHSKEKHMIVSCV